MTLGALLALVNPPRRSKPGPACLTLKLNLRSEAVTAPADWGNGIGHYRWQPGGWRVVPCRTGTNHGWPGTASGWRPAGLLQTTGGQHQSDYGFVELGQAMGCVGGQGHGPFLPR